jgi:hypothetical protein
MNGNDAMNDNDDSLEDDELMKKVSKPPEFPPATREQVELTWKAIAAHIATEDAAAARDRRPVDADGLRLPGWLQNLFPAAPAWSWQAAKVAALLVVGFGAAWMAASLGLLPGTGSTEPVTLEQPVGDKSPDRAWLAASDYGSRLEALLLGVAKGDDAGELAPAAREVSRKLLDDNRFYQRVAQRNEDAALSELLSRMEIILLTLATAPEGQEQEVVGALRQFLAESDVLGELREVQSTVPKIPRPRVATTGS